MKQDSPNKLSFLGAAGQAIAARQAQAAQAQQAASGGLAGAIGSSLGGSLLSGNTNLASDLGAATMDQANPFDGKTFQITPANMMGNAKPVFNESTSSAAAMMYGSPLERQMSMPNSGPVTQMKDIPEGNKGAGLRALDDSVVEQMGYDSATKMVSPVEFHEGVSHNRTVLGQKYSLGAENYADSVRAAKREQRFNEMMKPKMMKTLVDKSRVSTSTSAKTSSEAQEIPRIKKNK
tara:strand:- start:510 stop:1214 length:705 start_codon:yes stop_codon:yes gene_type:complete